jgi:hypothetical protein
MLKNQKGFLFNMGDQVRLKSGHCRFLESEVVHVYPFQHRDAQGEQIRRGIDGAYRVGDIYTESSFQLPYRRLVVNSDEVQAGSALRRAFFRVFRKKGIRDNIQNQVEELFNMASQYAKIDTDLHLGSINVLGTEYQVVIFRVRPIDVRYKAKIGTSWSHGVGQGDIGAPATLIDDIREPIFGDVEGVEYNCRLEFIKYDPEKHGSGPETEWA